MISIEAHRAAIGRFCRKFKHTSLTSVSNTKLWNEIMILMFLIVLISALYALLVTSMYIYYDFIVSFLMVVLLYAHSYWTLKTSSDILCDSVQKMAKRTELMRNPIPLNGDKVPPLIPCNYLDTYVFDGRCQCLETTFVLDGGNGESRLELNQRKLFAIVKKSIEKLLHYVFLVIICTSIVKIGNDVSLRFSNNYHVNATTSNLELYSLCHLKLSQLLLDGDVESNPGPVNNNIETPKGRG